MNTSTHPAQAGVGLPGLLALAFIVLKLTGVIAWSWWWVLAPLWIGAALAVLLLLVGVLVIAVIAERRRN